MPHLSADRILGILALHAWLGAAFYFGYLAWFDRAKMERNHRKLLASPLVRKAPLLMPPGWEDFNAYLKRQRLLSLVVLPFFVFIYVHLLRGLLKSG